MSHPQDTPRPVYYLRTAKRVNGGPLSGKFARKHYFDGDQGPYADGREAWAKRHTVGAREVVEFVAVPKAEYERLLACDCETVQALADDKKSGGDNPPPDEEPASADEPDEASAEAADEGPSYRDMIDAIREAYGDEKAREEMGGTLAPKADVAAEVYAELQGA